MKVHGSEETSIITAVEVKFVEAHHGLTSRLMGSVFRFLYGNSSVRVGHFSFNSMFSLKTGFVILSSNCSGTKC